MSGLHFVDNMVYRLNSLKGIMWGLYKGGVQELQYSEGYYKFRL